MTRGRERVVEAAPDLAPSSPGERYFALYCAAKMALLVAFAPAAAAYVGAVGVTAYVGHRVAEGGHRRGTAP